MKPLVYIGFLVLGILSLRGVRWAYVTFVLLGLLYFPASVGFRLNPRPCELIPDVPLAVHSLTNSGIECAGGRKLLTEVCSRVATGALRRRGDAPV
jgi:hypothetical protein